MDRSTPVSHLHRNAEQDPAAAEMMENIVQDLDHEGEMHQPQQRQPSQEEIEFMQHQMMMQQQQQQRMQQQRMMAQQQPDQRSAPLENQSFTQKLMSEAKEPLLVSVLVLLMSSNQLQSLIAKFLPVAAGNPLIGLALRAVVAGVLFYLLRRFIPN